MKWSKIQSVRYFLGVIVFLVLVLTVVYFWFFLFGGDYSIALPDGYSLVRVYAGAVLMADPSHKKIISPNIDGYKVLQHVVVGHVSRDKLPPEEAAESKPGYFVVDVRNGIVHQGLDERSWIDSLRRYGITTKPTLHKPSRFDQKFGY